MRRILLMVSLIALSAAPAAAQGKSKEHRRDGNGAQLRTNEDRNERGNVSRRSNDDDDDDDRRGNERYENDDRRGNDRYENDDRRDNDRYENDDRRGGYRSKTDRTYIDSRGLECREKTKVKKNGQREYTTKCKEPKNRRTDRGVSQSCVYGDTRCGTLPRTDSRYPRDRVPTTGRDNRTPAQILAEIAAQRRQNGQP